MDVREKLVELLKEIVAIQECSFGDPRPTYETVASYLMSHGVTVQEWISVKDRLPNCSGKYLVCTNRGNVYQTKFYSYPEETGGHWGQKDRGKSITHWCRLPQPPKGE